MSTGLNIRRFFSAVFSILFCFSLFSFIPSEKAQAVDHGKLELSDMAEEIVILTNEARAEAGLEPLYMVPYLCELADIRAKESAQVFSHTRPDGSSFITLIDGNKAPFKILAENLAAGYSDPENTFNQWRNSPRHWGAIVNPSYTHIGVAVYYDPDSTYKYYWEQFFIGLDTNWALELEGQYIPTKYKFVPQSAGDINGDGKVNVYDYVMLTQYLNKNYFLNPLQIDSADLLEDGSITYADASILRNYILGKQKTIPIKLF